MSLFDQTKQQNPQLNTAIKFAIGGVIGIVSLVTLYSSLYTIETGNVGVVSTFKKYNTEEVNPGLHVKIPFVQSVITVDTKMQTANYNGQADRDPSDGVYNLPRITVLDEKNLPIGLDVSVQFNVKPTGASESLEKYGRNYFDKAIHPVVRDVVRDVVGKYQAETIASQRNQINLELEAVMKQELDKLPEFVLINLALRDIELPPLVMEKIKQVQEAKQEESRLKMVDLQAQQ
jgi:regulator of protease activity HflC (stomatin/prohibitin superfamily)